jgi:hypothetical protein
MTPVFRFTLVMSLATCVFIERPMAQDVIPAAPRLVKDATKQPKVEDIEFVAFDFQQPHLYELTVHFGPIEGEPSSGGRYGVRALIGGERAIASATLEVVDEHGENVQRVIVGPDDQGGFDGEFIGVMTVPAVPFHVVLRGETADGQSFRRVYRRLFRPVNTPQHEDRFADIPGISADMAKGFQQMLDEQAPAVVAAREALVALNPSGEIVIPRMLVSNVKYAPLLSRAGAAIGIRVTYNVKFSQSGEYSPGLRIAPVDEGDFIVGRNPLNVAKIVIEPLPREAYAPHNQPVDMTGFYAKKANFLYEGSTIYTFTIELVPNFVDFLDRAHPTGCLSRQRFRYERDPAQAFSRMLAREGPTTYRVDIGADAFEGRVENFYGEGTLYRNLFADGTPDCGEKPLADLQSAGTVAAIGTWIARW